MMTEFFRKISRVPAVMIDGALYTAIAAFIPLNGMLSTDEAAKYIEPSTLYWVRLSMATILGGLGGMKMFRSTSYGDHVNKTNGHTAVKLTTETK